MLKQVWEENKRWLLPVLLSAMVASAIRMGDDVSPGTIPRAQLASTIVFAIGCLSAGFHSVRTDTGLARLPRYAVFSMGAMALLHTLFGD